MNQLAIFLGLLILLPVTLWFWIKRLTERWAAVKTDSAAHKNGQSEDAKVSFYSDLFLTVLTVCIILYFLLTLSDPVANTLSQSIKLENVPSISIRILFAVTVFLVLIGLLPRFIIKILPGHSLYISWSIAIVLSALVALLLVTSSPAFENLTTDLINKGSLLLSLFFSILFAGVAAWLISRRDKTGKRK